MSRVVPEYKEEARSRILTAAQAAFSEKGYDQTTMEDIAQRLGVSKGALYLYFPSKEALFGNIAEARQRSLRHLLQASLKDGDLLQASRAFFDAVMNAEDVYGMSLTFEVISEGSRNDSLKSLLLEDYNKRLQILGDFLEKQQKIGLIRDDVDIEQLSLTIGALFNGLIIGKILGIDEDFIAQTWMSALNIMYSSPLHAPL